MLEAVSAKLVILVHRFSKFTFKIGRFSCAKLPTEMLNKAVLCGQKLSKFTPPFNKYSITPMEINES